MSYARNMRQYRLNQFANPDAVNVLLEGDSWADIPLFTSNLGWALHQAMGKQVNLVNISRSGDLIANIASGAQFRRLKKYLKTRTWKFDILLLSGGGNDILVKQVNGQANLSRMLQRANTENPRDYIKAPMWKAILDEIAQAYITILDMVSRVNPNIRVVVHSYDYIYPRNKATSVLLCNIAGPWVAPQMADFHIRDQGLQRQIVAQLLLDFKDMLQRLATAYTNLRVVDTQGTLPEHQRWSQDVPMWNDEIHPDADGFNLIARRLMNEITPN